MKVVNDQNSALAGITVDRYHSPTLGIIVGFLIWGRMVAGQVEWRIVNLSPIWPGFEGVNQEPLY
jgi:hypothetical protein